MSLSTMLSEYVCAAFSGLYVHTFEPDEALREVSELCRQRQWRLAGWDLDRGLSLGEVSAPSHTTVGDPLAAIRALPSLATPEGAALLVLRHFHRFLGSTEIIQALEHQLAHGKVNRTFVVILAPVVQLPVELERLFVVVRHDLPDRSQLQALLDVGALMGSLVGQSEERTRQALQIVDAMAPCVLMIDEVEKALAGASGTGQNDSGVSSRIFGRLLSWLNDHESDVFVVCTANDVSKLPPEFSRAERFDGLFFLDLPVAAQRQQIWKLYATQFGLDLQQRLPDDQHWTGAEIRACCRLSALLDVPLAQAGLQVVPVAVTAAESVERLRAWANGRCLSADQTGLYVRGGQSTSRRRVQRDPSAN